MKWKCKPFYVGCLGHGDRSNKSNHNIGVRFLCLQK